MTTTEMNDEGSGPMARWMTGLLIACGVGLPAGCSDEPVVGRQEAQLTGEQCSFFAENDRVTICHHTGSARKPYTIIRTSTEGCADGHAGHAGDYVASSDPASPLYDPTCNGQGCLPAGAPADAAIECCEGLAASDGVCAPIAPVDCDAGDAAPATIATDIDGASDVVYDLAGNLYVTGFQSGDVHQVPPGPAGSGTVVASGHHPQGLARDAAGFVYIGYYGDEGSFNGSVDRFDPGTGTSTTLATGLCGPAGMTIGPDGALYVGSRDCATVYRVDTTSGDTTDFVAWSQAYDVAFDPAGNLFFVDWTSGAVWKRAPSGAVTAFASGLSTPVAVQTDAGGRVYVGELSGRDHIIRYTPDGTASEYATVEGDGGLRSGLVFDSDGQLVVSNIVDDEAERLTTCE
jgi:hypothetical protein